MLTLQKVDEILNAYEQNQLTSSEGLTSIVASIKEFLRIQTLAQSSFTDSVAQTALFPLLKIFFVDHRDIMKEEGISIMLSRLLAPLFPKPEEKKYLDIIEALSILSEPKHQAAFNTENITALLFTYTLSSSISALYHLKKAKLLTEETCRAALTHQTPELVTRALCLLQDAELINEENLQIVWRHQSPLAFVNALCTLNTAQLLTEENCHVLSTRQDPLSVAKALCTLKTNRLFTEENRQTIFTHRNPSSAAKALHTLNAAQMLTEENRQAALMHKDPSSVADALLTLSAAQMLTEENYRTVLTHAYPAIIADVLSILQNTQLLTEENYQNALAHQSLSTVSSALSTLQTAKLLTGENCRTVLTRQDSQLVAHALCILNRAKLLTEENCRIVLTHQGTQLTMVIDALFNLEINKLLTENYRAALTHQFPENTVRILRGLHNAALLTELNRTTITMQENVWLTLDDAMEIFWDRIPAHLLTQTVLDRVTALTQRHSNDEERLTALERYTNRLLNPQGTQQINNAQSTHTRSVHRSVSESATKLLRRYSAEIAGDNLDKAIRDLTEWVCALSETDVTAEVALKHAAAKRCIKGCIEDITILNFTDPGSKVTIHQLLGLVWVAIHDDALRNGSLEDAEVLLVDGLYEIRRGYNLSETGIDNGLPDREICIAGTFNKLVEKLGGGLHPDVHIVLITPNQATAKFLIVVQEELLNCLNVAFEKAGLEGFHGMLHQLSDDSKPNIWLLVGEQVEARLFDEFGSAYGNNRESRSFRALMDQGQDLALGQLPNFQKVLQQSAGYQAHCSYVLRNSASFFASDREQLIARRHDNVDAQHAYDKQFGLALRH